MNFLVRLCEKSLKKSLARRRQIRYLWRGAYTAAARSPVTRDPSASVVDEAAIPSCGAEEPQEGPNVRVR